METYDPRNPIIKATDDEEQPEVQGHVFDDADQDPAKRKRRAHEPAGEVQGHILDDADQDPAKRKRRAPEDQPSDRIGMTTDGAEDGEDDVEGHRLSRM